MPVRRTKPTPGSNASPTRFTNADASHTRSRQPTATRAAVWSPDAADSVVPAKYEFTTMWPRSRTLASTAVAPVVRVGHAVAGLLAVHHHEPHVGAAQVPSRSQDGEVLRG